MPRSRNIKPGFFDNSELGACSDSIRLLFAALWTLADKEGILEFDLSAIRRYAFGYKNTTIEEVNGYITVLSRLDNGNTISIRKYAGKEYIVITNFVRHQNPHHTEKKGKLPPLEALVSADNGDITVKQPLEHGENPADSGFLIPDSLLLIPDSHIPEKPGKKKITLHELSTDHVVEWLTEKRCQGKYVNHDEHEILEVFKNYCKANGKRYADYVAAYRNAFDWERFQPQRNPSVVDPPVAPLNKSQQAMQAAMRGVMKNYEIKG